MLEDRKKSDLVVVAISEDWMPKEMPGGEGKDLVIMVTYSVDALKAVGKKPTPALQRKLFGIIQSWGREMSEHREQSKKHGKHPPPLIENIPTRKISTCNAMLSTYPNQHISIYQKL